MLVLALTLAIPGLAGAQAQVAPSAADGEMLDGGVHHSVAADAEGRVWTWGNNAHGQLGDGTTTSSGAPVVVDGVEGAEKVAAGAFHTLAMRDDGSVTTWGANLYGQLGDGTEATAHAPVDVQGLNDVVDVAGGSYHSVAATADGSVWAWGYNGSGQLGDTTTVSSSAPQRTQGVADVTAVAAGGLPGASGHSLALRSDGTVWGWGDNRRGQLGNGTQDHTSAPVQVSGLADVVAIAAGGDNSYALSADGSVWAWGDNSFGQLGTPALKRTSAVPVQVSIADVVSIAAGDAHALAVRSDGSTWAWGNNNSAQLGSTTAKTASTPAPVPGLSDVSMVAAGHVHSLAATADGTAWAWGRNAEGQLGDGSDSATLTTRPVQSLAVRADGTAWAWGRDGSGSATSTPVRIDGLGAIVPGDQPLVITIDSPRAGDAVDASTGSFEITGTARGARAPLRDLVLLADGEVVATDTAWGSSRSSWSLTAMPTQVGDYDLEVIVTDEDGRSGSAAVSVTITDVVPQDPEATIVSPDAVVLDDALLAVLAPVEYPASTLRFRTGELPFTTGAVLVAAVSDATPKGLLVRALDITREGDEWVVAVETAPLDDLFVQVDVTLQESQEVEAMGMRAMGLDVMAQGDVALTKCYEFTFDQSLTFNEGEDTETGAPGSKYGGGLQLKNTSLNGCAEVVLTLHVERRGWSPRGDLKEFETAVSVDNDLKFDFAINGSVDFFKKKFPEDPITKRLKPTVFFVWFVPVVIDHELGIQMTASGGLDASVASKVTGDADWSAVMNWTEDEGWTGSNESSREFTYARPTFDGLRFDVKVGPTVFIDNKLYGVAGPRASVDAHLRGRAAFADDPNFPAIFKASVVLSAKLSAELPNVLGRWTPKWSWTLASREFELAEWHLGGGSESVMIAGAGHDVGGVTELASLLESAGYQVQTSATIPESLEGIGQLWWFDYRPFPSADVDRLAQFVRDGGGLYLTGERPCCEALNTVVSGVVNQLVPAGDVRIGGLGDPYYVRGLVPVNAGATDGLASNPFTVTEVLMDAPGGMAGVSGANVLASAPGNNVPVAAAWNASDLDAQGRLVVVMDVNWLDPSRKSAQANSLVQNLALFLSGLSNPPADVVTSSVRMQSMALDTEGGEAPLNSGTTAPR